MLKSLKAALCVSALALMVPTTAFAGDSASQAHIQAGQGISFSPLGAPVPSAGTLLRTRDEITFNGSFNDLDANSAYSVWWMITNEPEKCQFDCLLPDIEAGIVQIFYAGGFITGDSGDVTTGASLPVGAIPSGADRFSEANDFGLIVNAEGEVGLRDPFGSLVLVALRAHGPIQLDHLASQIGTYTGGCAQYPPEGDGNFTCFDPQAVLFAPVDRK